MSHGKGSRKLWAESERKMTALAFAIGQHEYTQLIGNALRKAFQHERHAVKRIAEIANCNEATARNWYELKVTPHGLHLSRLVAAVPELQAEWRRLCAMESDLDPEFERELHGLIRAYQKVKERV
jgi:hypothetical protein